MEDTFPFLNLHGLADLVEHLPGTTVAGEPREFRFGMFHQFRAGRYEPFPTGHIMTELIRNGTYKECRKTPKKYRKTAVLPFPQKGSIAHPVFYGLRRVGETGDFNDRFYIKCNPDEVLVPVGHTKSFWRIGEYEMWRTRKLDIGSSVLCGRSFALATAAAVALGGLGAPFAHAGTYYWDADADNSTATGGGGTWDVTSSLWRDSSDTGALVAWPNTDADQAVLAGAAGTLALNGNSSDININKITFGATGYTIAAPASGTAKLILSGIIPTIDTGGNNATISAVLSGSDGLVKNGSGILTLSGINTHVGGTTINAGIISIGGNNGIGANASAIMLNGGTLRATAGMTNTHPLTVGASGGSIQNTSTGTYIFNTANTLLGSGTLTIAGNGTITPATATGGVVVLNQSNTYNGNIVVQAGGLLEYANANAIATGGAVTVNNNGMLSVAGVNIARDVTVNAGGTLAFQNNSNGVYSGAITLNGDARIRMQNWWSTATQGGTITSTISGNHQLTIESGTSTGTGGTLTLGGFNAHASSADIVLNGASLAMNSNSGTPAAATMRGNSLTINTGNFTVTGAASQDTNDVFGTLNLGGGSAGNLQGYSTFTVTPNAATNAKLTFDNMGTRTAGSWVALNATNLGATPGANNANIYFTNGLSGQNLIGAGGMPASGTASVIPWLRASSGSGALYGYDATLGVVQISTTPVDLNSATSGQNVFDNNGSALTGERTINSLVGTGNFAMAGNTLNVTGGVIVNDVNLTIGSDAATPGVLNFGSAEGQLTSRNSRTLVINSSISGASGLTYVGFRSSSDPSLILAGANIYTGTTNFYGYGGNTNVRLLNSLALQNTTLNHVAGRAYALTFGNGGTSGQTAYTFGGLSGNANLNLSNNNTIPEAVTLTVGGNNESTTYSGVLSSTVAGGSLTKIGNGVITLNGINTYNGSTGIQSGTIALGANGAISNTLVLGSSGGTTGTLDVTAKSAYSQGNVSGSGTIDIGAGKTVTIASVTSPGFSIGTLNIIGSLALGETTAMELTSNSGVKGVASDYINVGSGALIYGGSLVISDIDGYDLTQETASYDLFDFGTALGTFANVSVGDLSLTAGGSGTWTGLLDGTTYTFTESTGVLAVVVPEPGSFALLAMGAMGMLRRRRMVA